MKKSVKKIVAVGLAAVGLAAFAEPNAKITNAKLTDAANGVVTYTYTVSGDFEGKIYDLIVEVGADGYSGRKTLSIENVAAGTVTTNVNVRMLLGKGCPNITLFASLEEIDGVQLWEGGPYWAECNVGATKPEESGYYFWWGDAVGYKRNANNTEWISVMDSTSFIFRSIDCSTCGRDISQLQLDGYIDSTCNLMAKHDAATVYLCAPWRMPTDMEIEALIGNCDTEWTTRNGVYGRLVKGRGAYSSKSIFLPAAGCGFAFNLLDLGSFGQYWSSTPDSGDSGRAWQLSFDSGDFSRRYNGRFGGLPVRAVRGFAK